MVDTSPSQSTATEVCSKCEKVHLNLLKEYETERDKARQARLEVVGYQLTLESLEAKILTHERNEVAWAKI